GNVEPIRSQRNRSSGVIADLYRIVGIERTHLFEIVESFSAVGAHAGERLELVRRVHDAGVHGCSVLSDGGGIVAVEDLTLRPFNSAVAGSTKLPKHLSPARKGRRISGLRLEQRAHRGKDPQCLYIEGIARSFRDSVVIDRRV